MPLSPRSAAAPRPLALLLLLLALLALPAAARAADPGWQPTADLAAPVDGAATQPALAVDRDGTVWGAWVRAATSGGPSLVQVASKPRGGDWSAPVAVSRPVGAETGSRVNEAPQIDVRDGVVAVAWLQTTADSTKTATNEAWVATRAATGAWRAAERRSPAGDVAGDPALAVRPDGGVTMAWTEEHPVDEETEVGRLVTADMAPAGRWGAVAEVSPTSASIFAGYLDIAVDETGASTLVWQDALGDSPTILAVRRQNCDAAWSDVAVLSDPADYSLYPQVALADDGSADVVWMSRVDEVSQFANYEVQTVRAAGRTGAWSAPSVLSAPGGDANGRGTSKNPEIAVDAAGNTTVAWLRSEGANADNKPDRAQVVTRRAGEDGWSGIADVWSGLRNPTLRKVSLAVGGDGQALVAVSGYTTNVGSSSGPRTVRAVRRETLGGDWSAEQELSVARAGSSTAVSWEPAVVLDAVGGATLAWHQIDATGETGVQTASYRVADPAGGYPQPGPPRYVPCPAAEPTAPAAEAP
ncbi:hypothetical protein ACVU7I_12895, partial [Patulibacter sp. S7RM1-6]